LPEQRLFYWYRPQLNISLHSTGRMWLVAGCAMLCVIQSALTDNGQSLFIALITLFTALLTEFLLTWRVSRFSKIADGSTAASTMILVLLLPNQIHPVYAALGAAFAVTVVKYSFGGLGANWLNPALGGWLFIRFSWSAAFTDALSTQPSIAELASAADISDIDNSVTAFFNDSVFNIAGVQLPSGYIDLLFSNNPGLITDRGLFALLAGTVVITAFGINRGWVPLVFLAVYGFLIRFAGDLSGIFWNGDVLYGLFSGGTIAAAFILAAEPASGAKLFPGMMFSVILGAVLSWFFRYLCMEYSGCFIALALVNCMTPLIKLFEDRFFISRGGRSAVPENYL